MSDTKPPKKIYTPEDRKRLVEEFKSSGVTKFEFCKRAGGPPYTTFLMWLQAYERGGPDALDEPTKFLPAKAPIAKRGRKGISNALKAEIKKVKIENPNSGARQLSGFLARLRGVKVSPNTIQKTLKKENMALVVEKRRRSVRQKKVRRFERASAMQLWQSDITSMVLTRHKVRVYLTVFMDDFSRYIVAWNLQLQQKSEFVMDTLLRGIDRFGAPEEVLTDQGRQYFAWRGRSQFEVLLRKFGIKHVVARSHHPQTVGKCERFWDTVKREFWEKLKPQDLTGAQERFSHFVNYYNHFRPHQSLDNMTPADRFFGVESELKKALERTYSENELRLALDEPPRTPVFLIGQIGDQPIALHGEKGKLVISTRQIQKEIAFDKFGHRGSEEGNKGEKAIGTAGQAIQSTAAGDSGEITLASSDGGAEEGGTRTGPGGDGLLDGAHIESGSGEEARNAADPALAAVAAGGLGYASGTASTTEREGPTDESERRPEGAEEENRGAREAGENAGSVGADPQADAGDLRGEEEK